MIILKNVSKVLGKRAVLSNISLQIDPQECVCITGAHGAGLSLLLALMVGAEQPTKGTVEIDGMNLSTVPELALQHFRRKVGIMFQGLRLLPNLTVAENIAFPLESCGVPDAAVKKRVVELLRRMDLEKISHVLPLELTPMERACTALARAVAARPLILIADDPTENLAPEESTELLRLLQGIHAEETTVIIATHDASVAGTLGARIIRIEGGCIVRKKDTLNVSADEARPEAAPESAQQFFVKASERIPVEGRGYKKVKVTAIGA